MASKTHPKQERSRLPWLALLALSTAVFITSLTETLPAGLLPGMSETLGVGASMAGQAVTVYAAGTALTAIPLARATARINRKTVLLWAMGIFAIANTLTAVVPVYAVMLIGRIVAGVAAGLAWAVLAGYARRLAPVGLEGRAISIAMTGIPVALALGVPVGTFIGQHIDWRVAFLTVTVATIGVIGWIAVGVPSVTDSSAEDAQQSATTRATLAIPGVLPIMIVVLLYVLGHTVIYSYIAPTSNLHSSADTSTSSCSSSEGPASSAFGSPDATSTPACGPWRSSRRASSSSPPPSSPQFPRRSLSGSPSPSGAWGGVVSPPCCKPPPRVQLLHTAWLRPIPPRQSSSRYGTPQWHSVASWEALFSQASEQPQFPSPRPSSSCLAS